MPAAVAIGTPYSVDRAEEVVMGEYRTATLDLKRRNRSSAPYADSEDDVRLNTSHLCAVLLDDAWLVAVMLKALAHDSRGCEFDSRPFHLSL